VTRPRLLALAGALLLLTALPASAHQLDEYLQATTISLAKDRVRAELRLTPGVAVFPAVFASIDTSGDGALSPAEQEAYARRVLRDLSLTLDGERLPLRLASWKFAAKEELKAGRGDMEIDFTATVPRSGHDRSLVFENHHQNRIAAYLVNCLVPSDPDIQVTGQSRNYLQSVYHLDYAQAGSGDAPAGAAPPAGRSGAWVWLGTAALLLLPQLVLRWRHRGTGV